MMNARKAEDSDGGRGSGGLLEAIPMPHVLTLDSDLSHEGWELYLLLLVYAAMSKSAGRSVSADGYYHYPGHNQAAHDLGIGRREVEQLFFYLRGNHAPQCEHNPTRDVEKSARPCKCVFYSHPLIATRRARGKGAFQGSCEIKFLPLPPCEQPSGDTVAVFEAGEWAGYSLIPPSVALNSNLTALAKRLYANLLRYAHGRTAYPSRARLAEDLGLRTRPGEQGKAGVVRQDYVDAPLDNLLDQGVLAWIRRGYSLTNIYIFPSAEHLGDRQWAARIASAETRHRYHKLVRDGVIAENGAGIAQHLAEILDRDRGTPVSGPNYSLVTTALPQSDRQLLPQPDGHPLPQPERYPLPQGEQPQPSGHSLPQPDGHPLPQPDSYSAPLPQSDRYPLPQPDGQEVNTDPIRFDPSRDQEILDKEATGTTNPLAWLDELADGISDRMGDWVNRSSNQTRMRNTYRPSESRVNEAAFRRLVKETADNTMRNRAAAPIPYFFKALTNALNRMLMPPRRQASGSRAAQPRASYQPTSPAVHNFATPDMAGSAPAATAEAIQSLPRQVVPMPVPSAQVTMRMERPAPPYQAAVPEEMRPTGEDQAMWHVAMGEIKGQMPTLVSSYFKESQLVAVGGDQASGCDVYVIKLPQSSVGTGYVKSYAAIVAEELSEVREFPTALRFV